MATFTLRLRENEAEALNRLSYVYGVSKNTLINVLIAREYNAFTGNDSETPMDEELLYMSLGKDFPQDYIEGRGRCSDVSEYDNAKIRRIVKCYDYAIEHAGEKDTANLKEARSEWVEEWKNRGGTQLYMIKKGSGGRGVPELFMPGDR